MSRVKVVLKSNITKAKKISWDRKWCVKEIVWRLLKMSFVVKIFSKHYILFSSYSLTLKCIKCINVSIWIEFNCCVLIKLNVEITADISYTFDLYLKTIPIKMLRRIATVPFTFTNQIITQLILTYETILILGPATYLDKVQIHTIDLKSIGEAIYVLSSKGVGILWTR